MFSSPRKMRLSRATISQTSQRTTSCCPKEHGTGNPQRRIDDPSGRQYRRCTTKRTSPVRGMRNRPFVVPIAGVVGRRNRCRVAGVVVERSGPCCPRDRPRYGMLSKGSMIVSPSKLDGGHQVLCPALSSSMA